MKRILYIFVIIISYSISAYSCSVCTAGYSDNEILAYSLSVVFLISILFIAIFIISRKIIKTYDIE